MGDCNSFILSGLWGIDGRVLIVPSGIETLVPLSSVYSHNVLIVPSGIETRSILLNFDQNLVLIVPSGIETVYWLVLISGHQTVLIVPSGIETI